METEGFWQEPVGQVPSAWMFAAQKPGVLGKELLDVQHVLYAPGGGVETGTKNTVRGADGPYTFPGVEWTIRKAYAVGIATMLLDYIIVERTGKAAASAVVGRLLGASDLDAIAARLAEEYNGGRNAAEIRQALVEASE